MGCVSLTAEQARSIAEFIEEPITGQQIWFHSQWDHVDVEIEDGKGNPVKARRFWENGTIQEIPFAFAGNVT